MKVNTSFINCEKVESVPHDCWIIFMNLDGDLRRENAEIVKWKIEEFDEPAREYLVFKEEKIICILEPYNKKWKVQIAIRFIRDYLRNELQDKGMLFMHGAFVVVNNCGVCILGKK